MVCFFSRLDLLVGRWPSFKTLPIDAGNEPFPLRLIEGAHGGLGAWPDEVTAMQTALTEPDAGAIPDQEFESIVTSIAEGVGAAIAGRAAKAFLDSQREAVDPEAHVHRFDGEPDLGWRDHDRRPIKSANHATGVVPGSSSCQPPVPRRVSDSRHCVGEMLTGTRVSVST